MKLSHAKKSAAGRRRRGEDASARREIGHLLLRREAILSALLKVEDLIERKALSKASQGKSGRVSTKTLDAILDKCIRSTPKSAPLPADFSRADLYEDHD